MVLYHFSEDPTIREFVPRAPLAHPDWEPLVWAIDAWHAPIYYVPRECPRVCFWPLPTTTPEDRERWFGHVPARMVVAIESVWLERLRTTQLYRYVMSAASFTRLCEDEADYGAHVRGELLDLLAEDLSEGCSLQCCPGFRALMEVFR